MRYLNSKQGRRNLGLAAGREFGVPLPYEQERSLRRC